MCGTNNPISVRGVPCALKHHLHEGSDRKALDALSRHGCQCNFLDWVANFRPVESEIPDEELLMCPMLWCREKFKSIASTVDHVVDCRRLSNAWYWCPYCKRPERFLKCDKGCELVKESRLRRKNSGLHKAISFFNYFGRRRSWRIAAAKAKSCELDSSHETQVHGEHPEDFMLHSGWPELSSRISHQPYGVASGVTQLKQHSTLGAWVNEKATNPGDRSGMAELEGADLSTMVELGLSHTDQIRGFYEMYDPAAPANPPQELAACERPGSKSEELSSGFRTAPDEHRSPKHSITPKPATSPFERVSSLANTINTSPRGNADWAVRATPISPYNVKEPSTVSPLSRDLSPLSESVSSDSISTRSPGAGTNIYPDELLNGATMPPAENHPLSQDSHTGLSPRPLGKGNGEESPIDHHTVVRSPVRAPLPTERPTSDRFDFSEPGATFPRDGMPMHLFPHPRFHSHNSEPKPLSSRLHLPIEPSNTRGWLMECVPANDLADSGITRTGKGTHIELGYSNFEHHSQASVAGRSKGSTKAVLLPPNGDAFDGNVSPTGTQIEQLRDLIEIVNREWLERMISDQGVWLQCSELSVHDLFEGGINTLQHVLEGNLSLAFKDVFALIHMALAAAYILHRDDDEPYYWTAFLQDAFHWQLTLSSKDDEARFINAMVHLGVPFNFASNYSFGSIMNPGRNGASLENTPAKTNQDLFLSELRSGMVFKDCLGFLEGFEEANFIERYSKLEPAELASSVQSPPAKVRIYDMVRRVTDPLRKERGIEAFRHNMVDAEFKLRSGLLRNPRELEIALLSSGRWSSRSRQTLERYHKTVSGLCDNAMNCPNSSWRDPYLIADLYDIIARYREMNKSQQIGCSLNHWPDTSVLSVIQPAQSIIESPTSMVFDIRGCNLRDASAIITTQASVNTSQKIGSSSPSATTTQDSTCSSSGVLAIPISEEGYCQSCSKTFVGTPQNRKSNLMRHYRTSCSTSRHHNKDGVFKCPKPGCSSKYTRTDNLNKHLRKTHRLLSRKELREAIEISRSKV